MNHHISIHDVRSISCNTEPSFDNSNATTLKLEGVGDLTEITLFGLPTDVATRLCTAMRLVQCPMSAGDDADRSASIRTARSQQ